MSAFRYYSLEAVIEEVKNPEWRIWLVELADWDNNDAVFDRFFILGNEEDVQDEVRDLYDGYLPINVQISPVPFLTPEMREW